MKFNYYVERRKFEKEWAAHKKEYQKADMSDEIILKIREIDLEAFKSRRRYETHTMFPLSSLLDSDGTDETRTLSKCTALAVIDIYFQLSNPDWIEYVENKLLYNKLKQLPRKQIELLTYFLEGYTETQIAELLGVSQQTISKNIISIKKVLLSFDFGCKK